MSDCEEISSISPGSKSFSGCSKPGGGIEMSCSLTSAVEIERYVPGLSEQLVLTTVLLFPKEEIYNLTAGITTRETDQLLGITPNPCNANNYCLGNFYSVH